jgi:hypothetical protein
MSTLLSVVQGGADKSGEFVVRDGDSILGRSRMVPLLVLVSGWRAENSVPFSWGQP